MNPDQYGSFDSIALFNTMLGLINMEKNSAQQKHQEVLDAKLDEILSRLTEIERRLGHGIRFNKDL